MHSTVGRFGQAIEFATSQSVPWLGSLTRYCALMVPCQSLHVIAEFARIRPVLRVQTMLPVEFQSRLSPIERSMSLTFSVRLSVMRRPQLYSSSRCRRWRRSMTLRRGRLTRMIVNVLGEFKDLGVEFVSVRDGLNFSGPLGMALYALVAALAEAEVEALRERTVAGLRNAKAKGKRLGRPPTGKVEISRIVELKTKGLPQHQIASNFGVSRAYVIRELPLHKPIVLCRL